MLVSNPVLNVIKHRRAIRKYKPDPVPDDLLLKVLEAARWAPSGHDMHPVRFVVVRDSRTRKILGELAKRGSGRRFTMDYISGEMQRRFANVKNQKKRKKIFKKLTSGRVSAFLADVPVVIVVCGHKGAMDTPYDCSAAIQNMLLAATSLGLGTCWVMAPCRDIRDEAEVRRLLKIPRDFRVIATVALGHPDESPKPRPRLPLDEVVFGERWGERIQLVSKDFSIK